MINFGLTVKIIHPLYQLDGAEHQPHDNLLALNKRRRRIFAEGNMEVTETAAVNQTQGMWSVGEW